MTGSSPPTAPSATVPLVAVPPLTPDDRFAVDGKVRPLPAYDAGREPGPRLPGSPGSDLLAADAETS